MLVIEECANSRAVTVFVRGSNKMVSVPTTQQPHPDTRCSRSLTRPNVLFTTPSVSCATLFGITGWCTAEVLPRFAHQLRSPKRPMRWVPARVTRCSS
jgi:T-complex protein 1 subunit epsilon